jgi:hypothetical protein
MWLIVEGLDLDVQRADTVTLDPLDLDSRRQPTRWMMSWTTSTSPRHRSGLQAPCRRLSHRCSSAARLTAELHRRRYRPHCRAHLFVGARDKDMAGACFEQRLNDSRNLLRSLSFSEDGLWRSLPKLS